MKLKIGNKLRTLREERKQTHEEMARLLQMSASTYGRYERNETYMNMDTLSKVAELLDLPIQDFFPETFHINSTNNGNGQASLVMGNYTYYAVEESSKEVLQQNMILRKENDELKEYIRINHVFQQEHNNLKEELKNIKNDFDVLKTKLGK